MNKNPLTVKKGLFILQLYPPIHGASTVGEYIKNSKVVNEHFESEYIRISTVPVSGRNWFLLKIWNYIVILYKVAKKLAYNNYDFVYVSPCASGLAFYKDFFICITAKALVKGKMIYHFHNKGISTNNYVPNSLKRFFFKNTKVILSSERLKYDVVDYVEDANLFFIPYGIPDEYFMTYGGVKSNAEVVIIFFAHLMKEKGPLILLRALKELHVRHIDFKCNFIGGVYDIDERTFLDLVAKYGLAEKVFYLGPKYNDEKDYFLSQADIFAFPTYYKDECFPLVLLEALRHGVSVVTTEEGAIPDIIEDGVTGLLIPKNDYLILAEKLQFLIEHPNTRELLGKEGRKKFEAQYMLSSFENKFARTLKDIIAERKLL